MNDGGPAFPVPAYEGTTHDGEKIRNYHSPTQEGMSLRDYFAAQAMGPLMASDGFEKVCMGIGGFNLETDLPKFAAQEAYRIADAMLKARGQ